MKSVMTNQHSFSQVPRAEIPRSKFDRSHGYKTTFDAGYLIPVFIDEALPGDTFSLNMSVFARLATPVHPIMDNMFLDSFFFAVPYRLVWSNFNRFMGEQPNTPEDSTDFTVPQMTSPVGGYAIGSLSDYFGLPTVGQVGAAATVTHNCLFHRAYNLIWNEWFRDQNLQDAVTVDKGDAASNPANYVLLKRGKRHDYFTSCLPWPQKGDSVPLPLTGNAPVLGIGVVAGTAANMSMTGTTADGDQSATPGWATGAGNNIGIKAQSNAAVGTNNRPQIFADLSDVTAATINELRQAFQLQRLVERDARGGTRYTEIIRAHFGVVSPDARLQRPEYLGGSSTPVNINPIAQTTPLPSSGTQTPQGNLAGMGTVKCSGHGFTKSFTEHTLLIGMVCVRADLNYQQGLNRMFFRRTKYDHYWPALAGLGEQPVYNKEIFCDGSANDDLPFGYQERFAEYRYKPSQITGLFRSTAASSLDVWHLAQEFGSLPTLAETFIQEDPPIDRVIAVQSEPHFLFDSFIQLTCARPMPVFGVPGYIDHF